MRKPRYSHEAYGITKGGKKWNLKLWTPGIASEFIHCLPDLLAQQWRPVVLLCRVSYGTQEKAGNLDDETRDAMKKLREMGFRPGRDLFIYDCVESSSIHGYRPVLERAIEDARRRGAILVAPHRDRFIRSDCFDRRKRTEAPSVAEYMQLRDMAGDVPLATILHPDSPNARSHQIKRGQREKGRTGGRPKKSEKRKRLEETSKQRQWRDAVLEKWRSLPIQRGERVSDKKLTPRFL